MASTNLTALEAGWGGGIAERMARQYAAFQAAQGVPAAERSEM
jgi:hypothetical protein